MLIEKELLFLKRRAIIVVGQVFFCLIVIISVGLHLLGKWDRTRFKRLLFL